MYYEYTTDKSSALLNVQTFTAGIIVLSPVEQDDVLYAGPKDEAKAYQTEFQNTKLEIEQSGITEQEQAEKLDELREAMFAKVIGNGNFSKEYVECKKHE